MLQGEATSQQKKSYRKMFSLLCTASADFVKCASKDKADMGTYGT